MRTQIEVSAVKLSTYRGGGIVKRVFMPETVLEFVEIYSAFCENGIAPYLLGGGSNTIVADEVITRPIISTRLLSQIGDGTQTDMAESVVCCDIQPNGYVDLQVDCLHGVQPQCFVANGVDYVSADKVISSRETVRACAGAPVSSLCAYARAKGLGGLEFLTGVPCSVGGAVKMNAGAFGKQIADFVSAILVARGGKLVNIPADQVEWGYRRGVKDVVVAVDFALKNKDEQSIKKDCAEYVTRRRQIQPTMPSVGSVFKSMDKSAGWYVEQVGLKGERIGGAKISEQHANFIVNLGGGSAEDYLSLVRLAEKRVYEEFGKSLEREFVLLE